MKLRLLKAVPLAAAAVLMLPLAAHAEPWQFTCSKNGTTCVSGGVVWYNRSVGVQGHASYLGSSPCSGLVDFYFFLDEAENVQYADQSRSVCDQRDFHFTQGGPQGGIRAVEICVTDTSVNVSTNCTSVYRSHDPSNAEQLPTLPDYDVGS